MMVADTDILIDFLSGKDPGASRVYEELEKGVLYTTVINRFELLSGSGTKQIEKINRLLNALKFLALDIASVDRAATLRRQLDLKGQGIGMADSLIAGIVLEHRAVLLTRNIKHYSRVHNLQLSHWK